MTRGDIKENELGKSSAHEFKYVRGLDAGGNSKIMLVDDFFNRVYGQNVDCNEYKETAQVSATKWENAPAAGVVAILTVIPYLNSLDWVIQEFTALSGNPRKWIRCWYGGSAWSDWRELT